MEEPLYQNRNKPQAEQTADPSKYPQGFFKEKPCRKCGTDFAPKAPSSLYCSQPCADYAVVSAYLKRTYGIDYSLYQRMAEEQRHVCKICGEEGFIMNKERHKLKLVVDHCHTTGMVRGLLCHNCNRALGLFKDDTARLTAAVAYLKV